MQNEVKENYAQSGGFYVMSQDGKTNGKNAWLKGEYAIWYNSENWMIGQKSAIGTEFSYIHSTIDAQNPTLVGNYWKYGHPLEAHVEINPGDFIISNIKGKCFIFDYV